MVNSLLFLVIADAQRTNFITLNRYSPAKLVSTSPAHYVKELRFYKRIKWAWEDLNLRPHAYQACALTT